MRESLLASGRCGMKIINWCLCMEISFLLLMPSLLIVDSVPNARAELIVLSCSLLTTIMYLNILLLHSIIHSKHQLGSCLNRLPQFSGCPDKKLKTPITPTGLVYQNIIWFVLENIWKFPSFWFHVLAVSQVVSDVTVECSVVNAAH